VADKGINDLMSILSTIVTVFLIIFLGLFAKQRGFFSPDFAVAVLSICTILSSVTYSLWLSIG